MLLLLHGSDSLSVYNKLNDYPNFTKHYGDLVSLKNSCFSTSLFDNNKPKLTIDLSTDSKINFDNDFLNFLNEVKQKDSADLIVALGASIKPKKSDLAAFDKTLNFDIKNNTDVFKFLDALFSKNTKVSLTFLDKFVKHGQEIYLISMLFYYLKNILLYHYDRKAFLRISSYVQQKTSTVAQKYVTKKISKDILHLLCEADYKLKTASDSKNVIYALTLYINSRL